MDDARRSTSSPANIPQLRALLAARDKQLAQRDRQLTERDQLLAQHQAAIATLTRQRDEFYLKNLQLEVRLAKALKQAYGPRADRLADAAQMLLDFGQQLETLPLHRGDLPPEEEETTEAAAARRPVSRRIRTRGRRDIGALDHLPLIEQKYELTGDLCLCPACQGRREKIGEQVSYTIEHVPATFVRIKHIQGKYACRCCEQNGDHPQIELAAKTGGSPIDKGLPGPGLLAYIATSKYADYLPLHRLQGIFARNGFELDRSTMCLWMADVARLVRPVYELMVRRVLRSQVLATDDTILPLLAPGRTRKARMWIYLGDDLQPYNVFAFTISRSRDGPTRFLQDFSGVLLADAYGGYDGIVLDRDLRRAGCWSHARRKFIEAEPTAPDLARTILRSIKALFDLENRAQGLSDDDRLNLRRAESQPIVEALHAIFVEQKAQLLPKHPMAEAIAYALNQWPELTLFTRDGAVPLHNNLAEQQMKRIALLRKNALFVGTVRGGETAAVISTITSTCRRHDINPQVYLTQLLTGLPDTPLSQLDRWLPDQWKAAQVESPPAPPAAPPPS
jgi:transposase